MDVDETATAIRFAGDPVGTEIIMHTMNEKERWEKMHYANS